MTNGALRGHHALDRHRQPIHICDELVGWGMMAVLTGIVSAEFTAQRMQSLDQLNTLACHD